MAEYLHSSKDQLENINSGSVRIGYNFVLHYIKKIDPVSCGMFQKIMRYSKKLKWPVLFLFSIGFSVLPLSVGPAADRFAPVTFNASVVNLHPGPVYRTELYFGLSKTGGSEVTAEEGRSFWRMRVPLDFRRDSRLSRRWDNTRGTTRRLKERRRVLILLYEKKTAKAPM